LTVPGDEVLSTADLLVLPLQVGAPAPGPKSFWVVNSRASTQRLQHPDNFNTLFLELQFPQLALGSLNGTPLTDGDSVLVTVDPTPGAYGFTVSPAGLVFRVTATPKAALSFAVYADVSVATGSPTYATANAFVAALDLWQELTVDRWRVATGSRATGVDQVEAALASGGSYLLAAPR